jgi:hypothetical protein
LTAPELTRRANLQCSRKRNFRGADRSVERLQISWQGVGAPFEVTHLCKRAAGRQPPKEKSEGALAIQQRTSHSAGFRPRPNREKRAGTGAGTFTGA